MSAIGSYTMCVLDMSINSTTSTWYLSMSNYVGSIYIAQIDSSGIAIGAGVWSNVSVANNYESYDSSYCDAMSVSYNVNSVGTNYGLIFSSVNLISYGLYTTYIGINGPTAFTSMNPNSDTVVDPDDDTVVVADTTGIYTINNTGTTGITPIVTYGSNTTSFVFYPIQDTLTYTSNISFSGITQLVYTTYSSGIENNYTTTPTNTIIYTTFLIDATPNTTSTSTSSGNGASCLSLQSTNFIVPASTIINVYTGVPTSDASNSLFSSLSIGTTTYDTSNNVNSSTSDFVVYAGGAGSALVGGGGAGGTTSVGGDSIAYDAGGLAGTGTNGVGKAGQPNYANDTVGQYGAGGGAVIATVDPPDNGKAGMFGAVVVSVYGLWYSNDLATSGTYTTDNDAYISYKVVYGSSGDGSLYTAFIFNNTTTNGDAVYFSISLNPNNGSYIKVLSNIYDASYTTFMINGTNTLDGALCVALQNPNYLLLSSDSTSSPYYISGYVGGYNTGDSSSINSSIYMNNTTYYNGTTDDKAVGDGYDFYVFNGGGGISVGGGAGGTTENGFDSSGNIPGQPGAGTNGVGLPGTSNVGGGGAAVDNSNLSVGAVVVSLYGNWTSI